MRKFFLVLALIVFVASSNVPKTKAVTSLETLALNLSANQWGELTSMTNWSSGQVLLTNQFTNCTNADYITEFADKGTWDTVNNQFHFIGQSHGNCYGGEHVIWTDSTNTWDDTGSWPTTMCQNRSGGGCSTWFGHAYDTNAIDNTRGDYYFGNYDGPDSRYHSGSWSNIDAPVSSGNVGPALEYVTAADRVIRVDGSWGVWVYNPNNGNWTRIADTGVNETGLADLAMPAYNTWAANSVICGCVYFGGDTNMYSWNGSTISTLTGPPASLIVTSSTQTVDPVSGDIIALRDTSVYRYSASGNAWSTISTTIPADLRTGSGSGCSCGTGDGLIAAPIDDYGVIMYVKYKGDSTGHVWIYKATDSAPPPPATMNYAQKIAAQTGLIRTISFVAAHLTGTYGDDYGDFINAGTSNPVDPVLDTSVKASGQNSIKFTTPNNSDPGSAGQWFTNFSTDRTVHYGAGTTFYIQWMQKWDRYMLEHNFTGEGFKLVILTPSDPTSCTSSSTGTCVSSNSGQSIVMQNVEERGFAGMYSYNPTLIPWEETFGGDIKLQNAMPSPFCLYTTGPTFGGCLKFSSGFSDGVVAETKWATITMGFTIGSLSGSKFVNSNIDIWWCWTGGTEQKIFDYTVDLGATDTNGVGKIWMLPYITGKSSAETSTQTYTWMANFILATSDIPHCTNEITSSRSRLRLR